MNQILTPILATHKHLTQPPSIGLMRNVHEGKSCRVRVMSWNFLEGGLTQPDDQGRRTPHNARREAAVSLVHRINPDILILNEALGGHPGPESLPHTDYGQLFGFKYHAAALYSGAWGNAIMSRFHLLETKTDILYDESAEWNRGWLATRIETPAGKLWIGTYHPHPGRQPEHRRQDMTQLLDVLNGNAIFAGDLNAIHPDYPLQREAMLGVLTRLQGETRSQASLAAIQESGRLILGRECGVFAKRGWSVADTGGVASIPTRLIQQAGDPGLCIDHLAVSPGLVIERAWIDTGEFTDEASDHYPLVAELIIKKQ